MTRYVEAFSWTGTIQEFLDREVTERPLLNVCSGTTPWGDVMMDRYEPSSVRGDWTALPFATDSFAAVFADPPWDASYKAGVAAFMREALRIAPVAYLMAPWVYGAAWAKLTDTWVRQMPGVNVPILLTRYIAPQREIEFRKAVRDDYRKLRASGFSPTIPDANE